MISKERLEELIEQNKSVRLYRVGGYYIDSLYPKKWKNYELWEGCIYRYSGEVILYKNLFETEEDAKWYKEFGNITRTERLELQTWEEFSKWDKLVKFYNKGTSYSMYVFIKNKNTNNCRIIIYADNGEQDWLIFEKPLTKENYTLACRKAKELFLGEKE